LTVTPILGERPATPDNARPQESLCRLFVRDLVLSCDIGVHPEEHGRPQRVRVNVDLWAAQGPAPVDDAIDNVVSYEDVISGIEAFLGRGHINLVETAAEGIAALCLEDRRVVRVRVRMEKLDVFTNVASVGVEIERRRRDVAPPGTLQVVAARDD